MAIQSAREFFFALWKAPHTQSRVEMITARDDAIRAEERAKFAAGFEPVEGLSVRNPAPNAAAPAGPSGIFRTLTIGGARAQPAERAKEAGCSAVPTDPERERNCREPWHLDDGVPYCDICGLFRASVRP